MSQIALPLLLPPIYSAENFFVSGCNEQAHLRVMQWPKWLSHCLIIHGEKGTGKTHLGHIWSQCAQAEVIAASQLKEFVPVETNLLIEDIEQAASQLALLHAFNYTRENGKFMLMTSAVSPQALPFALADLTSRLRASPSEVIAAPSDDMLAAALRKQFADRQLKVAEEVIEYLLPRMERSLAGVHRLVEVLDAQALAAQRSLTVPFVRRVLDEASVS